MSCDKVRVQFGAEVDSAGRDQIFTAGGSAGVTEMDPHAWEFSCSLVAKVSCVSGPAFLNNLACKLTLHHQQLKTKNFRHAARSADAAFSPAFRCEGIGYLPGQQDKFTGGMHALG